MRRAFYVCWPLLIHVEDVHNLAIKLAAVYSGQATEAILEKYEDERRQVALVNAEQSLKNGRKIFALLREVEVEASSVEDARSRMLEHLQNQKVKSRIDSLIEDQREHFDNVSMHRDYCIATADRLADHHS